MEPILPATEARAPPALANHLLEEILVRIHDPTDLARTTAMCKTFRRLVTDPNFLRRYRSIHPPILLGFIDRSSVRGFLPVDAPHPNAPAAHGFAGAAEFTYDYIPRSRRWGWAPYDARDGRVLLMICEYNAGLVSPEFAVCGPLTRGYTLLPPIPDDVLASVGAQVPDGEHVGIFNAFFDHLGGNGGDEDAQFRVMCCMPCVSLAAVFVYSSVFDSWTHGTSIVYAALGLNVQLENHLMLCRRHSWAYGCVYWDVGISNKMIKLDINSMAATTFSLPADHENRETNVVDAGEGKIGMLSLSASFYDTLPLRYSIQQNESENASEHLVETTISLPCECDYCFAGSENGYVFLKGLQGGPFVTSAAFSVEIKTLKVERVCVLSSKIGYVVPYFGFPPFMSPRI
ncbi:hypothetical protein QOZ80_5AG0385350 [Eleusine coracana subsp. coracana]|nr:hypothetical protein QOZ80_5AG0385350 [Eleusine coracana subsp. coracana]